MSVKRAIAMVTAFCLGVAVGLAVLFELRPSPRTVVDPIKIEVPAGSDSGSSLRGDRGPGAEKREKRTRSDDRTDAASRTSPGPAAGEDDRGDDEPENGHDD